MPDKEERGESTEAGGNPGAHNVEKAKEEESFKKGLVHIVSGAGRSNEKVNEKSTEHRNMEVFSDGVLKSSFVDSKSRN